MSVRRLSILLAVVLTTFTLSAQPQSDASCQDARKGATAALGVNLLEDGRSLDRVFLEDMAHRNATVRLVPMRVVTVPGAPGPLMEYLPNCADCTEETPCYTECGWDPGKGGPVTCGEYGVCSGWPRGSK